MSSPARAQREEREARVRACEEAELEAWASRTDMQWPMETGSA